MPIPAAELCALPTTFNDSLEVILARYQSKGELGVCVNGLLRLYGATPVVHSAAMTAKRITASGLALRGEAHHDTQLFMAGTLLALDAALGIAAIRLDPRCSFHIPDRPMACGYELPTGFDDAEESALSVLKMAQRSDEALAMKANEELAALCDLAVENLVAQPAEIARQSFGRGVVNVVMHARSLFAERESLPEPPHKSWGLS